MNAWAKQKGFTIVELLIVVVVIAILAAITITAYNGIQERARNAKISNDISEIVKAIMAARAVENKTLMQITGLSSNGDNCWNKANGTDLATLAKTDTCWTRYTTFLSTVGNLANMNLSGLVDPWGRPYLIDENEGEGTPGCGRDTVAVFKQPFTTGFGTYSITPTGNIPLSGLTPGC